MKLFFLFLVFLLASTAAWAGTTNPLKEGAYACAESIQAQVGLHRYELVKVTQRGGNKNFNMWLNAHDENVGAFCEIRRGNVVATHVRDAHWSSRNMREPVKSDLAAR